MVFSSILRMPVPAILPPAIGFTGSQKYHHSSALSCTVNHRSQSLHVSRKSSSAVRSSTPKKQLSLDEILLRVLDSEIAKAAAEESDGYIVVNSSSDEQIPNNFPFTIQDNPGEQMISLTRQYKDETIVVEVYTPDENEDDELEDEEEEEEEANESHEGEGEEEDQDEDDSDDDYFQSSISLAVKVSKKSGHVLEFGCTAYPNDFGIDYLSIKDTENPLEDDIAFQGPKFTDFAEDLQDALYKYLEIRGFSNNTASFLHDYMTSKGRKEYTIWLKKLKKFVQE